MKKLLLSFLLVTIVVTGYSQATNLWDAFVNEKNNTAWISYYDAKTDSLYTYSNSFYLPNYPFTEAPNGLLYGVYYGGGTYNYGILYSFDITSGQESTLLNFDSVTMGGYPACSVVLGSDGQLYGMCQVGGKNGLGTFYSYNIQTGKDSVIINFDSLTTGAYPEALFNSLVIANNGLIYGTTTGSINYTGTSNYNSYIFSYDPLKKALSFSPPVNSLGISNIATSLLQVKSGLMYGTFGGDTVNSNNYDVGGVFSYNPASNTLAIESYFNDSIISSPWGGLVQDTNGIMYGVYAAGGNNGLGGVYSFDPVTKKTSPFLSFDSTTIGSVCLGLFLDSAGIIYGATQEGGIGQQGSLFEFNPFDSTYSIIISFDSNRWGENPMFLKTYNISGIAYNNVNGTCNYASNDPKLQGVPVIVTNNLNSDTANLTTATGGTFFTKALAGIKCTVAAGKLAGTGLSLPCPMQTTYTDSVTSLNNNLALKCSNGFDLSGNLSICVDTPGFSSAAIQACIFNNRCQPVNGQLKLIIDPHITVTGTVAGSAAVTSGDTLIWSFDSISTNSAKNLCVSVVGTVGSIPASDSVFATLLTTPVAGDSVPNNNQVTYWVKPFPYNCVGLPYDPNNKSVSPVGNISSSTKLTYAIHFQNTGTAVAKNVVVVDTLSQYVDASTLKLLESSAPVTVQIAGGHIVTFTFNGINLPDTGTSKTTSIGSFEYSISPLSNAPINTNIANKAYIYFDANAAIITNTTSNKITSTITGIEQLATASNGIACFPNPFSTSASVVFSNGGTHYLELDDITGRRLRFIKCEGNQYKLAKGDMSAGVYILRSFNADMSYSSYLKIVVQ